MYTEDYEVFGLKNDEMLCSKLEEYRKIETVKAFLMYFKTDKIPLDELFAFTAKEIRKDLAQIAPVYKNTNAFIYDSSAAWKASVYYGFDFALNDVRKQP